MRLLRTICIIAGLAALRASIAFGVTPQGAAFTYQGQLKQGGELVNGNYHLRFQLWNALIGGAQVGLNFDVPALEITDGLFTVDLDFGSAMFDGSARWLQVHVITNDGATVTTLSPRQPITPSPYAFFALSANGPGLTNLNASNIASGNLASARLPTGGGWSLASNLNIDSNTLVVDQANNNVGVGTSSPDRLLHLEDVGPVMILQDTASAANQAGYIGFWNNVPQETGWVGFGTPGSPHFSVVNARSFGDIQLMPAANGSVDIIGEGSVSEGLTVGEFLIVTDDGAVAAFDRLVSDGPIVDFRQNGTIEGTISVTGTTVSYGAFTGCHYGWSDRAIERGTLVMMTGENRRRTDDPGAEPIYGIEPSILPNDPRCLGAYLSVLEPAQPPSLGNPHQIMAVGNGDMWVVEPDSSQGGWAVGRDIQPGDYLISSDIEGHAMLDDPKRFPIGHVVARAAEAVNWDGVTVSVAGRRHRRISVFFENFERGSSADAEIASLRTELADLKALVGQLTSSRKKGQDQ